MLKQRIITAVGMALLFLAMLFLLPGIGFAIVVIPLVMMAAWEWSTLIKINSTASRVLYLIALAVTLTSLGLWVDLPDSFQPQRAQTVMLGAVTLWAVIFLWVQGYPSSSILWSPRPVLGVLCLLLLGFTWLSVVSILASDYARWGLLVGVIIVVLADVGGFVAGKLFGKHKLAPLVSPGKTWEGFLGGMIFQLILIVGLAVYLPPEISIVKLSLLVFPVALYSVVGDLFESMIKRNSGVKDSGALLPGHGGVLDRIDGIMAALPLYALVLGAYSS
jgi:phosphatidate cytidylyltransferase